MSYRIVLIQFLPVYLLARVYLQLYKCFAWTCAVWDTFALGAGRGLKRVASNLSYRQL